MVLLVVLRHLAGATLMPCVPGRLAGITGNAYLAITGDAVMEDPWIRSELPTLQQAELFFSTGNQERFFRSERSGSFRCYSAGKYYFLQEHSGGRKRNSTVVGG